MRVLDRSYGLYKWELSCDCGIWEELILIMQFHMNGLISYKLIWKSHDHWENCTTLCFNLDCACTHMFKWLGFVHLTRIKPLFLFSTYIHSFIHAFIFIYNFRTIIDFFVDIFCSLPDKLKSVEKIDQYILKVEDFVGRARKLENDILRYYCSVQFDSFNPVILIF